MALALAIGSGRNRGQKGQCVMSAISSVGSGLQQFVQGISVNAASGAASTQQTTVAGGGDAVQGAHHHHRGGGGAGFAKVQQAVTSALEAAKSSGSTTDPNRVIQDAIKQAFQQNQPGGTPSAPAASGADADGDQDGSAAAGGSTSPDAARQAFAQTLQSFGVSEQQFHADFAAALQGAQGGQADASAAFKSFPAGSVVDTAA